MSKPIQVIRTSPKTQKKSSKKKIVLISVLSVVALILVLIGGTVALALTDDNAGKYHDSPSEDITTKLIVAAGTGEEVSITPEEMNGYIAHVLQKMDTGSKSSDMVIKGIHLTPDKSENLVNIYAPVTYKGFNLGITAKASVTMDEEQKRLAVDVKELKVGRVTIPTETGLGFIKGHLPQGVTVVGQKIFVSSSLLSFSVANLNTPLEIKNFYVQGGDFKMQTTGMLDVLKDYIKNNLSTQLGGNSDLLNGLVDEFGSKLSDILKNAQ